MHFDAARLCIVKSMMPERRQIEISFKLAIDARKQIEVERRGYPRRIVIRQDLNAYIFFKIRSQQ